MFSRTINVDMSAEGMRKLSKEIAEYKKHLLAGLQDGVDDIANCGIKEAKQNYGNHARGISAFVDEYGSTETSKSVRLEFEGSEETITWNGFDNPKSETINHLLMAEFGSGPQAIDGHRGELNKYGYAFKDKWSYVDNDGEAHWTSGEKATRPVHKAYVAMESNGQKIMEEALK